MALYFNFNTYCRKLKDKYGSAALEIERKRKEIFDNEWENVMRLISDQFSV